jgi:hypothetical protein
MKEENLIHRLGRLAEEQEPGDVNLWPAIREHFEKNTLPIHQGKHAMNPKDNRTLKLRLAGAVLLAVLIMGGVLFTTPQGRVWAQETLRFFTRAESDTLPHQIWQMTSTPSQESLVAVPTEIPTPDPSSILVADKKIEEVETLAGYSVQVPGFMVEGLPFSGASFESDRQIVRIFYGDNASGLVLREEQFNQSSDCELCTIVGASAEIQTVQIGDVTGEYVVGVWKLTEQGSVWEPEPFLQTIRWQKDGMAFEILYMGQPELVQKEDLIAIAASIK